MIVRLWNRDLEITDAQQDDLTDYIVSRLSAPARLKTGFPNTEAELGRESVSHLIQCIRCDTRMKFPTRTIDAESVFEALGFTLDRETDGRGTTLRTYVTV